MFFCWLVSSLLLYGTDEPQPATGLPPAWQGTWKGTMVIHGPAGQRSDVPLVFRVAPLPGSTALTWVMTYGTGEKTMVKDYKLVPVPGKPGRFQIDEKNGITLDARLADQVLYSQFGVGKALLTARYELRGDTLWFEVTSAQPAPTKTGGQVQGYIVDVVQAAALKKQ